MRNDALEQDATVHCLETEQPCGHFSHGNPCSCLNCMGAHPAQCSCGICLSSRRFWAVSLSISRANNF